MSNPLLHFARVFCAVAILSATSASSFAHHQSGPDFNGDGYDDLAIGVQFDSALYVLYGGNSGLKAAGSQKWTQDSSGIYGSTQPNEQFGNAVAWGDFDGDGYDDVAVGAWNDDNGAGAVNVIYGSSEGLHKDGNQLWTQDSSGIADHQESDDHFGYSLCAGDFNGDGRDDLAIGVPWEDIGKKHECGAVHVLYGTASGLKKTGSQFWHQNKPGVVDNLGNNDFFGYVLDSGDFNGDNMDDLAISVYHEKVSGYTSAGGVHILNGRSSGLTSTGDHFWTLAKAGIQGEAGPGNAWGWSLAVGDFNGDGFDDLAVGTPWKGIGTGWVSIIDGSADGLTDVGNQHFTQNVSIALFAWSLEAADFDGDGIDDLAIGMPGIAENDEYFIGMVRVIYGTPTGLSAGTAIDFMQPISGNEGPEGGDWLGASVSAGDFNNDGQADLAVGAAHETISGKGSAGEMDVWYGTPLGITEAGFQAWHKGQPGLGGTLTGGSAVGWSGMK